MQGPALTFQDDTALFGPNRDQVLSQLQQAGGKRVRINAIYGKVADRAGNLNWQQIDDAVNAARAHGLRPQLTLMGTPDYMLGSSQNNGLSARTPNSKLMGQYAKQAAQHFKGRVDRYSIWNEPNWQSFLHAKDRPTAYRRLYDQGYAGVKAADPSAQVLLGELAPGSEMRQKHSPAIGASTFLSEVLAANRAPVHAYGVALHPYQMSDAQHPATNPGQGYVGVSNLGAFQRQIGREAKAGRLVTAMGKTPGLFITEFGYQRGSLSPGEQARRMGLAYQAARRAGARQFTQYQVQPSTHPGWDTSPAVGVGRLAAILGRHA